MNGWTTVSPREEVLAEHEQLISAIEARDDAASAEIAERHVGQPSASGY